MNVHSHADIVKEFLVREKFFGWVKATHEPELLGTAGESLLKH